MEPVRAMLSVIVCSHNPRAAYLQRALDCLRVQTLPFGAWEFLLIDNASSQVLSLAWDLSWHPRSRHIREDELGLTAARLRGLREARGELIVFVDDDNLLQADFLAQALALRTACPYLGVFGAGRIEPEFEAQPARELQPQLPLLALRSVASATWSKDPTESAAFPWGAGLCVTREVAAAYVRLIRRLDMTSVLGRRGRQLLSGEDDLFSWAAAGLGQGFGIFPELALTHLISSERLTHDYFVRLIQGHAFSHGVMNYVLSGSLLPVTNRLHQGLRIALHGLRNGRFSMRCQLAGAVGRRKAARFISEHRLQPLTLRAPTATA